MADMRASDWLEIGKAGAILLACLFGTMALIAAWPHIVSTVSGLGARARAEGEARRAYRQRVYDHEHMSSNKVSRALFPNEGNGCSYAVEQGSDQTAFHVPAIWEQLEQLSEDELLDALSRVRASDGSPRFADSRIAKFIGGRVEDRVKQVRDVRGTDAPAPKPRAVLRVRDNGLERLIDKYGH